MGGVLQISARPPVTWLPQSRVFDPALEAVAGELGADTELARQLEAASAETGYADVRALAPERFRALADAASRALAAELARGPARADARLHLRYGMSLLRALLAADERAAVAPGEAELPIRDDVVWQAPAAIVRLAREHLAAAAGGDAGAIDLQAITPGAFGAVLDAVGWMATRYAPEANLEANAVAPLAVLHPPIVELAALVRADPRAGPAGS